MEVMTTAEVIKIEIPVSVQDKTQSGLKSAQENLNAFERSVQNLNRQIGKITDDKFQISLDASDAATAKIGSIDDALSRLSGTGATVSIDADDAATGVITGAEDELAALDGSDGTVGLDADDGASGPIGEVEDAVGQLNGSTATVDVTADDAATGVLDSVSDKAASMDGQLVNIVVQATDSAGNALDSAGHNLWGQAGKVAGVMGASFGILDSINTYSGFEAGMDQVLAISGATEDEFAALTEKAKEMGATTKFTATESATAMNYMAMAGWKAGDMISGISGIMNLAAASGEDLGTTSDIVTDALTAFGLQASDSTHFADVMAQAAANANTNVGMMGESFKYVAPVAGALGYDIEDVALALGIMANSGIKSSMAGTSLRRALSNLASPTKQQREAMEQYGMSLTDGSGRMKTLAEIMTDMRDNLGGLEADEQAAAVSTMFGNQAMSGMLAIINASEKDYNKLADAIDHADGASQRMADTMLDNMQGSFTLMQSAIEGVEDDLGEGLAPLMRLVADSITEAMPGLGDLVSNFFDGFNEDLENLKNSKAWKEADVIGKIDLAWDQLIADPLSEWIDGNGASTISGLISGLFEKAFAILPGGESPALSSWLSSGVLFLVGQKLGDLTTDVYDFGKAIGEFHWGGLSTAGMIAVGVGAAAAATAALATAIEAYNQTQIGASLEEHFGDITLTEEQLSSIADQIIPVNWTADVTLAIDMGDQAEQARQQAEDALKKNEAIEYQAQVGVKLTKSDLDNYSANVDQFVKDRKDELDGRSFQAHLLVTTFLDDSATGRSLASAIDSWTLADSLEMDSLSNQLTTAVDNAISDGILSAGETQHIAELQQKINDIMGKWSGYESQAQWDVLTARYSGQELTGESYQALVGELQEHREANNDRLDQATEQFYTLLHAMDDSGRLDEIGLSFEEVQSEWDKAMQYERNRETANSLMFQTNTLNGAYSDEISSWNTEKAADRQNTVNTLTENMGTGLEYNFAQSSLGAYQNQKADKGLASLYEQMLPDVNDMQTAIQQYMQDNQAVPKALYESFMEAMQIGAASGDESAGWQMMANDIAQSGNEALIQAIQNGNYGPELQKAMEMSLAETAEDSEYTIDSVTAKINGAEVDPESTETVQKAVQDTLDGAGGEATVDSTVTVNADGTEVDASGVADQVEAATTAELAENEPTPEGQVDLQLSADPATDYDTVYGQIQTEINTKFAAGFDTTAPLRVTLTYSITNPTASIGISGSAPGTVTASIVASAEGRFVDSPFVSLIGEDGPEYVIPVGSDRRDRGLDLWMQAGRDLGVTAFADGGVSGKAVNTMTNSPMAGSGSGQGITVTVQNPTLKVDNVNADGLDADGVRQVLRGSISDFADDMSNEIANRLALVFGNSPKGATA